MQHSLQFRAAATLLEHNLEIIRYLTRRDSVARSNFKAATLLETQLKSFKFNGGFPESGPSKNGRFWEGFRAGMLFSQKQGRDRFTFDSFLKTAATKSLIMVRDNLLLPIAQMYQTSSGHQRSA